MSETLPSHQNEPQPWQRELVLHGEVSGTLNPNETLALMGSWAERDLAGQYEIYEPGTKDLARQEAVYGAALGQLAELRAEKGDSMNDVMDTLYSRQQELKDALRRSDNQADNIKIGEQLAGMKLLDDIRLRVTDQVGLSAEVIGSKSSPRDKATAINEMIVEHNEWVSRGSETIADSPEMQEAQARINARFAEQAKQPQPTETVADARKKVSEAFSGTGEKERQALIGEVAQAAKGATRIHTDRPNGVTLKSISGDYVPRDGFASFGDGLPQENRHGHGTMVEYGGSAEAMLFAPDTTTRYKTITKTVETGGRFMKKTQQVEEQVPDGEIPTMVVNPATGQQEPGIKVAYQFNGNSRKENGQTAFYEGPAYVTESGRAGNQLFVEATLPKSVADKLKQGVSNNPEIAREFAKTLALNNGITEQVWKRAVRPPYDQVPDGWEMTVADLQLNQYGYHDVVARQAVQVSR